MKLTLYIIRIIFIALLWCGGIWLATWNYASYPFGQNTCSVFGLIGLLIAELIIRRLKKKRKIDNHPQKRSRLKFFRDPLFLSIVLCCIILFLSELIPYLILNYLSFDVVWMMRLSEISDLGLKAFVFVFIIRLISNLFKAGVVIEILAFLFLVFHQFSPHRFGKLMHPYWLSDFFYKIQEVDIYQFYYMIGGIGVLLSLVLLALSGDNETVKGKKNLIIPVISRSISSILILVVMFFLLPILINKYSLPVFPKEPKNQTSPPKIKKHPDKNPPLTENEKPPPKKSEQKNEQKNNPPPPKTSPAPVAYVKFITPYMYSDYLRGCYFRTDTYSRINENNLIKDTIFDKKHITKVTEKPVTGNYDESLTEVYRILKNSIPVIALIEGKAYSPLENFSRKNFNEAYSVVSYSPYALLKDIPRRSKFINPDWTDKQLKVYKQSSADQKKIAEIISPIKQQKQFSEKYWKRYLSFRLWLIHNWLNKNGVYSDKKSPETKSFDLDGFLLNKSNENYLKGNSFYFSTALVILLRSCEIPARLASGYFVPLNENDMPEDLLIQNTHQCFWAEIYIKDYGWTPVPIRPEKVLERNGQNQVGKDMLTLFRRNVDNYKPDKSLISKTIPSSFFSIFAANRKYFLYALKIILIVIVIIPLVIIVYSISLMVIRRYRYKFCDAPKRHLFGFSAALDMIALLNLQRKYAESYSELLKRSKAALGFAETELNDIFKAYQRKEKRKDIWGQLLGNLSRKLRSKILVSFLKKETYVRIYRISTINKNRSKK